MADKNDGAVELFRKYRPDKFADVVGQETAIAQLVTMGQRGEIPHCLMFVGPSGCGKTTLARILRLKLKCADADYTEINASEDRGIDMVRKIIDRIGLAPLAGPVKVYLIDECQSLTASAQESLLKPLEEPPKHVYFFLCTTDPQKLKATTKSRGTKIICSALTDKHVMDLMHKVCATEGITASESALAKLVEAADGNARQALVILHQIRNLPAEQQLAAVENHVESALGFQLAKLVCKQAPWVQVAKQLDAIFTAKEDPDAIRRVVLGYARTMLMSGNEHAGRVLNEFRSGLWESHHPGLALMCWNVRGK
jgi:DNA polymerase-3 subunit gamma/tau